MGKEETGAVRSWGGTNDGNQTAEVLLDFLLLYSSLMLECQNVGFLLFWLFRKAHYPAPK